MFFYMAIAGALLIAVRSTLLRNRYQDCAVATGLLVFSLLITWPEKFTIYLHPQTMDLAFSQADKWLHLDALATALWVQGHFPRFSQLLAWVYYSLPLMMAFAYTIERNLMVPKTALLGGLAAYPFYNLYPAVGPAHFFVLGDAAGLPRNCMPSMHFSWALLVALNCKSTWLRGIAWTFFVLTACSTIVWGEHYFIDLIAAVPFSYAVQLAAERYHATVKAVQPA